MLFRFDFIKNILNYVKAAIDQIYIDIDASIFPVLLTEDTVYLALTNGARAALPTINVHAADIAQVLCTPAVAPDGAKNFKFFYHI